MCVNGFTPVENSSLKTTWTTPPQWHFTCRNWRTHLALLSWIYGLRERYQQSEVSLIWSSLCRRLQVCRQHYHQRWNLRNIIHNSLPQRLCTNHPTQASHLDEIIIFKGVFTSLCKLLFITCIFVAPENDIVVWMDLFFHYLDKEERITTDNANIFSAYMQGALFSAYTCNYLPIVDTDLIHSLASKFRVFTLPNDINL